MILGHYYGPAPKSSELGITNGKLVDYAEMKELIDSPNFSEVELVKDRES